MVVYSATELFPVDAHQYAEMAAAWYLDGGSSSSLTSDAAVEWSTFYPDGPLSSLAFHQQHAVESFPAYNFGAWYSPLQGAQTTEAQSPYLMMAPQAAGVAGSCFPVYGGWW